MLFFVLLTIAHGKQTNETCSFCQQQQQHQQQQQQQQQTGVKVDKVEPETDENANKKLIEALIIETAPPTPPRRNRRGFVDVGVQTEISGLDSETCTCQCHHHQEKK